MTLYFAYGANLDRAGMARRCPRSRPLGTARLEGHRFRIMEHGYATVVPVSGAEVHGVLWEVAPDDLPALDAFEEVDAGLYLRAALLVHHGPHRSEAMVYLAGSTAVGVPCPGYMEAVLRAATGWALPSAYLAELRGWLPGT
ncbi:MAG: gamma-glutamylcyclotransferase [Caulobacteraceae bacterium]|nr:gamma-glutamylcyclotransferase [Caulobacter sp.]